MPILAATGTNAGYDPTFMAGYAKSIYFPQSSNFLELVMTALGRFAPDVVYKLFVLITAGLVPWLFIIAARLWRLGRLGEAFALALFWAYIWIDFPMGYINYGMLAYYLGIPLGLVATGSFARYCDSRRFSWWLISAVLMASCLLVHATTAMIVVPAAAAAYLTCVLGGAWGRWSESWRAHLAVLLIPFVVLMVNAFWWVPGIWLTAVPGPSGFVFAHPEGVLTRLRQIATTEARIEPVLIVLALPGAFMLARWGGAGSAVLLVFIASGFGWGYLAGGSRARWTFFNPGVIRSPSIPGFRSWPAAVSRAS